MGLVEGLILLLRVWLVRGMLEVLEEVGRAGGSIGLSHPRDGVVWRHPSVVRLM